MDSFRSGCAAILLAGNLLFAEAGGPLQSPQGVPASHPSSPKTVLHLGGGSYSPWYSLGALYALRDYGIPVDSVVGLSWGAFVGALWSSGFELDEIQRIFTDSLFTSSLLGGDSPPEFSLGLPVSARGAPSLAFRFTVFGDSLGFAHFRKRALEPDSAFLKKSLLKFRIEEALSRGDSLVVPFAALSCREGRLVPSTVKETLPFSRTSGEKCPGEVPEDSLSHLFVIAYPVRGGSPLDDDFVVAGFESTLSRIRRIQDGNPEGMYVVVRPHSVEASPLALMQSGYADLEKKLGELSGLSGRKGGRPSPADSILPRFRMEPSFDSLPAAYFSHVSSFWNAADTGRLAPENFLRNVSASPFYDSVEVEVDSAGVVRVLADAASFFEFRVGGFGSNLTGPLAYAGLDFRYVDQFEYAFSLEGFAGEHSFAVRPEFSVRGLFGNRGGFSVSGSISKVESLKGYFSDLPEDLKILWMRTNDLDVAFLLRDSLADFRIGVLLQSMDFRTSLVEDGEDLHVNTLIPELSFVRNRGGFEEWFGGRGYRLGASFGFRSVNLTADGVGTAPLYFSSTADGAIEFSPVRFLALGVGAVGGVNIRRESGEGYEYPAALGISPGEPDKAVDNYFRLHASLSPWTSGWNFAETSSHHYGAVRASVGLHGSRLGLWAFAAYMRDFEENPFIPLDADRFLFEPLCRFAYRSIDIRLGMSRLVSLSGASSLLDFGDYNYFFQVGADW